MPGSCCWVPPLAQALPSIPSEAAEPGINHSRCTLSHLAGIGPSATPRRIVNTKHMLCVKLIIILGSRQLLVIGSPFAEITGSSRVEIQPCPGSVSNEMSPWERWMFCRGLRDTSQVVAFNTLLHMPHATVAMTQRYGCCLGTLGSPWQSRRRSRPFLGSDWAGEGQVLAAFLLLTCCRQQQISAGGILTFSCLSISLGRWVLGSWWGYLYCSPDKTCVRRSAVKYTEHYFCSNRAS